MISQTATYVIIFSVLFVYCCLSGVAAYFVITDLRKEGKGARDYKFGAHVSRSASECQGPVSLGLSFFASATGAWVLFAAPEVGILSGWWGTLGCALASALPCAMFAVLGPIIRQRCGGIFYMWVYLVAELASVGNLIRDMAGLSPLVALLPVSISTMVYTSLVGVHASLLTDRLQGVTMVIFIIVTVVACSGGLNMAEGKWDEVSTWSDAGFESLVTLVLALLGAELVKMGTWQRVYAAQSVAALRKGCLLGGVFIFVTMFLFGLAGMLAEAQDRSRPESSLVIKSLGFFDLFASQGEVMKCFVLALALIMLTSSVDSLQTGFISVLSKDILITNFTRLQSLIAGQAFLVAVNVPAIIIAFKGTKDPKLSFSIINLFLLADLLALSIAMPILMGLKPRMTQNGAFAGCFAGLLLIMGFGWAEFGTFMAGLEMFTLMALGNTKPPEVGLGAGRTCIIFVLLPIVSGVVTYFISWMERFAEKFSDNCGTAEVGAIEVGEPDISL
eukprot:CAMPEP_0177575484 /NCGR_PEP_ID=MMETSP0369-20130122/79642_1 /TAXON_ID=447022 ORGANISM="Scrippsiella hangoei-like, Strain SHHI-4" /NCGR_SAMPLE_ID=MMETSP0369 /ASSEMBLY_ACC=CAM_ASM_000364 /LENGTH=502 /DNA_ID=CAMNT_0019063779 /DNA_START=188 /DNA_END=1696 /DNA_ORIENTATION=-